MAIAQNKVSTKAVFLVGLLMAVGFGVATAVTSSVLNWIDPEYVLRSESPLAIERIDAREHLWMLGLLLATLILAAFGLGTLKKSNLQLSVWRYRNRCFSRMDLPEPCATDSRNTHNSRCLSAGEYLCAAAGS